MAFSFTPTASGALAKFNPEAGRRKVLVTGAEGRIGGYFAEHSHDKYDLRLMVRKLSDGDKVKAFGEVQEANLADLSRLKELCAGVDTVVHMAGDPNPAGTFHAMLDANIVGVYNIMVAAKSAGCRRLIHASSIHAVSGYPSDMQVKTDDPVNPGDIYGVSKCFGEALGRYMAEKEGLSVITLRIGAFQPVEAAQHPDHIGMMDAFVSQRDLTQLIQKCIDVENLQFAIFHGLSNNRFQRLDITDARALVGYEPQDDFTELNPRLSPLHLSKNIATHNVTDGMPSGIREDV